MIDLSKPMADIALLFHGRPSTTMNARLLEVVNILVHIGFVKESAGLVVLTERTEAILEDYKIRAARLRAKAQE